jgi:predicted ATPase with chaperone activity
MQAEDPHLDALVARLSGLAAEVPVVVPSPTNQETVPPADETDEPARSVPSRAVTIHLSAVQAKVLAAAKAPPGDPPVADRPAAATPVSRTVASAQGVKKASAAPAPEPAEPSEPFFPRPPRSMEEVRISERLIESLVLKYLLNYGTAAGRTIAEQVCLPFAIVEKLLTRLKTEQLVIYRGAAAVGDYDYQLTEKGCESAARLLQSGSYVDAVPVHLDDYTAAVQAQSISRHRPTMADVAAVFHDLRFDPALLNRIGQALDAGKGFFLYGKPGNGKTSIAERIAAVFGEFIWIPRALGIGNDVIRLFDPCSHVEAPPAEPSSSFDRRWVRIRRPAIVAGGELTMDRLDIAVNHESGVHEAPLQLKSNCGTLVIDDFGRQRISPTELLNRWIVPLDRGVDYLHLPGGRTIQVPFDQLLVFATNLEPSDLVDEAFLRRIPYKLELVDPTEAEFLALLRLYAERLGISFCPTAAEYLLERHYRSTGRTPRRCQARDLLAQILHYCRFNRLPLAMTPAHIDQAVGNYFTTATQL